MKKKIKTLWAVLFLLCVVCGGRFGQTVEVQGAVNLAAPKIVSVKASGTSKVTITWDSVAKAQSYRVYIRTDGQTWKTAANRSQTGKRQSFTSTGLKPGTRYYMTVRAVGKEAGKQVLSSYDSKYAVTGLSTPQLVSAKNVSNNGIKVTWKKVTGAKGYEVYRKNPGTGWKKIKTITSGNTVTMTDTGFTRNKANTYTVRAYVKYSNKYTKSAYNKTGVTCTVSSTKPKVSARLYAEESPTILVLMIVKNNGTSDLILKLPALVQTNSRQYEMIMFDGTNFLLSCRVKPGQEIRIGLVEINGNYFDISAKYSACALLAEYQNKNYALAFTYDGEMQKIENYSLQSVNALPKALEAAGQEAQGQLKGASEKFVSEYGNKECFDSLTDLYLNKIKE